MKFMSTFPEEDPNLPGRNFTIPSFTRPSATIWAQGKLWKKVADLHLRDLDDIEHHVSSLRNALPPLPNRRKDQVYFKGTYSTVADETEKHLVGPYPDTSDHLLSLVDEPEGHRRPASQGLNIYDLYGDESSTTTTSTASPSETSTENPLSSSTVTSNYSEHTIVKMVSAGKSRGRRQAQPDQMTSQPLTQEAFDEMIPVRQPRAILGAVVLPLAVAATAMGLFNQAQIETLRGELFQNQQSPVRSRSRFLSELLGHPELL
jgi:hypothetical protein